MGWRMTTLTHEAGLEFNFDLSLAKVVNNEFQF
jgi:hypothetical protein